MGASADTTASPNTPHIPAVPSRSSPLRAGRELDPLPEASVVLHSDVPWGESVATPPPLADGATDNTCNTSHARPMHISPGRRAGSSPSENPVGYSEAADSDEEAESK